jgi:hypothetical protein
MAGVAARVDDLACVAVWLLSQANGCQLSEDCAFAGSSDGLRGFVVHLPTLVAWYSEL